jgi:hypothetical protein
MMEVDTFGRWKVCEFFLTSLLLLIFSWIIIWIWDQQSLILNLCIRRLSVNRDRCRLFINWLVFILTVIRLGQPWRGVPEIRFWGLSWLTLTRQVDHRGRLEKLLLGYRHLEKSVLGLGLVVPVRFESTRVLGLCIFQKRLFCFPFVVIRCLRWLVLFTASLEHLLRGFKTLTGTILASLSLVHVVFELLMGLGWGVALLRVWVLNYKQFFWLSELVSQFRISLFSLRGILLKSISRGFQVFLWVICMEVSLLGLPWVPYLLICSCIRW